MAASTSKRPRPLATAGMRLTERDVEVVGSVWTLRQVTLEQIQRLHFGSARTGRALSPSIVRRRLGLLRRHEYLLGRRLPVEGSAGRPPFVYSLGRAGVPLVAAAFGLERSAVAVRQRHDAKLGVLFFGHRRMVNDVQIALRLACAAHGHRLAWTDDDELAALAITVAVDGTRLPVRPDGFLVIELTDGTGRTACFVEVQRSSDPAAYRRKARAYMAFWSSGDYTRRFGMRSLRVLGITDTAARAHSLKSAAEHEGGATLFWSTHLAALQANPFGAIWHVAQRATPHRLLEVPS